jgi:hypothetical protein
MVEELLAGPFGSKRSRHVEAMAICSEDQMKRSIGCLITILALSVVALAATTIKLGEVYQAPTFTARWPLVSMTSRGVTYDVKDVFNSKMNTTIHVGRYMLVDHDVLYGINYTDVPFILDLSDTNKDNVLDAEFNGQVDANKMTPEHIKEGAKISTTLGGLPAREMCSIGSIGDDPWLFCTIVAFQGASRAWIVDFDVNVVTTGYSAEDADLFFGSIHIK